jgi:hypothetical protein
MLSAKEKCARRATLACLKAFPLRFKNIPTVRALEVLIELGHGSDQFWGASTVSDYSWSARRLADNPVILESFPLARDVTDLKFYGGPTSVLKLYTGTLLALLMDRLLCAVARSGFKALDAVIPLREAYTTPEGTWY